MGGMTRRFSLLAIFSLVAWCSALFGILRVEQYQLVIPLFIAGTVGLAVAAGRFAWLSVAVLGVAVLAVYLWMALRMLSSAP
jgi:hypothetical protein